MEVFVMSQKLTVELSDDVYAAIERQAVAAQTSPAHIIATSLELYFRVVPRGQQRSEAELQAARERFEHHFGAVDLGYATGIDTESIDADLAREYADTHEEA
jgi:predicted transcriptional regulator